MTDQLEPEIQLYKIEPQIRSMRVPIFQDPFVTQTIMGYLKSGVYIQVIGMKLSWLNIKISSSQTGYIQAEYARKLTPDEQKIAEQQGIRDLDLKKGAMAANTSPSPYWIGLLLLAIGSCIVAAFLTSIVEQQCVTTYFLGSSTSCQTIGHPYVGLAGVIGIVSLILLVLAVLTFLGYIFQSRTGQK